MSTEIYVYFTLTDFEVEPEEISTLLCLSPSEFWKEGDKLRPNSKTIRKENGWQLKSDLENTEELENHVQSIIKHLKPNWNKLVQLTANCYTELAFVIYIEDEIPSFHLDKDIVKQLAELNAEIDVDLYDFRET